MSVSRGSADFVRRHPAENVDQLPPLAEVTGPFSTALAPLYAQLGSNSAALRQTGGQSLGRGFVDRIRIHTLLQISQHILDLREGRAEVGGDLLREKVRIGQACGVFQGLVP